MSLLDLVPNLRVDPGEPAQMRQVRRRDGDSIAWLAGEDGVGVKRVGRRRGYARLSEKSPKLRSLDDRIGRQSQVPQAAARIEVILEAPQAADGADSQKFASNLVVGYLGDDDRCTR